MERVCDVCGSIFKGTERAKFCNATCRQKAFRNANVTQKDSSVTKEPEIVEMPVMSEPVVVTQTPPLDKKGGNAKKWDSDLKTGDPKVRITKVPTETIDEDYWTSQTYLNLIEELETKEIPQLKAEGYFIPAWKLCGKYDKKPYMKEMIK